VGHVAVVWQIVAELVVGQSPANGQAAGGFAAELFVDLHITAASAVEMPSGWLTAVGLAMTESQNL